MSPTKGRRSGTHVSWSTLDLVAEQPLPGDLFLAIRHRLVRFRGKGDALTRAEFDKFIYNQVECVFIDRGDLGAFTAWSEGYVQRERDETLAGTDGEQKPVLEAALGLRRTALDLFSTPAGDEEIQACVASSQRMVTELLKRPYVVENIGHLQRYGRGCIDHSVNVAVLSVYLGVQMGFTSQSILEHLAMGGLMHDLGKAFMNTGGEERVFTESDPEYRQHPILGVKTIEGRSTTHAQISNEVRMIIGQHHEFMDGSGYPNGLQGLAIYELTRIVAIANVYDNLVSECTGDIKEKQIKALGRLEKEYVGKLDRKKLEKALTILRKAAA